MKKQMDLFGQALYDYIKGENYPFFFEVYGERYEHNLNRYFRSIERLSKVEKKLISMCYGKILDVGCGTGNYFPALNKKGYTIGIDISPKVVDVANKMGIKGCFVMDVFSFNTKVRFDTITMFENNFGMGETISGTKKLLQKLNTLLKEDGQLLLILSARLNDIDYLELELTPIYKNIRGECFNWLNFNIKFLSELCYQENFNLKTVCANKYYSLIRITKITHQKHSK